MSASEPTKPGVQLSTYKQEAVASRGMVAANHPLASAAGIQMLAMGGTAADAAVAALFVLSVVEPMMVGIFGAGFVNYYDGATDQVTTIDAYTVAPGAAAPDMFEPVSDTWPEYLDTVGQLNRTGHLAAGVPGALKCWCHMEQRCGKLGLNTVVQPAIRYAESGFPVSGYLADIITDSRDALSRFPASREIYLPKGTPPAPGQTIVNTDYAGVLREIARDGEAALSRGKTGELVAAEMQANGGILTTDDIERYQMRERDPVRGTYRGYEIVSVGPTSSGGAHIVQGLNLLEGFDVAATAPDSTTSVHLLAEVLKIAFADRFEFMGNPDYADVPMAGLTSKQYAAQRRQEIDLKRASQPLSGQPWAYSGESDNTTHVTVADADGNIACMTQSINEVFGAKLVVPGTGMLLNNTMYFFDPHPGHANSIAPGKRMTSSMSPTLVLRDGRPFMALGTPGGRRIFAAVLQAIVSTLSTMG